MNDITLEAWLETLAARTPAPGGGAAGALATAMAAGLLGMVTAYTTGEKWQDREEQMTALNSELIDLRGQALNLLEADAEAFNNVIAAYKLPKSKPKEKTARDAAIQRALAGAIEPPRMTIEMAQRIVDIAQEIATNSNPNVMSDVAVAASMARSALEAGIVNIEINLNQLQNIPAFDTLYDTIDAAHTSIEKANHINELVRKHIQQGMEK